MIWLCYMCVCVHTPLSKLKTTAETNTEHVLVSSLSHSPDQDQQPVYSSDWELVIRCACQPGEAAQVPVPRYDNFVEARHGVIISLIKAVAPYRADSSLRGWYKIHKWAEVVQIPGAGGSVLEERLEVCCEPIEVCCRDFAGRLLCKVYLGAQQWSMVFH